jgi:hypothetical protein
MTEVYRYSQSLGIISFLAGYSAMVRLLMYSSTSKSPYFVTYFTITCHCVLKLFIIRGEFYNYSSKRPLINVKSVMKVSIHFGAFMFVAKRVVCLKFSELFTYSEVNKFNFPKITIIFNALCSLNFIVNNYLMRSFHRQPFADLAVLQMLWGQNKYWTIIVWNIR